MAYGVSSASVQQDERGQGLVEYVLILSLVAIVVIISLQVLGTNLTGFITDIGNSV
jgi:Flp pilus assembly pilin Flp